MHLTAIPVFFELDNLLFDWTRVDKRNKKCVCVSSGKLCLSIDEGLEDVWNVLNTNWIHSVPALWAHCVPLFSTVMPFWSFCLPTLSVLLDPCPVTSDFVCMWHPDITQGRKTQWAQQCKGTLMIKCLSYTQKYVNYIILTSNSKIFNPAFALPGFNTEMICVLSLIQLQWVTWCCRWGPVDSSAA